MTRIKRIALVLFFCLMPSWALASHYTIKAGSTSQTVYVTLKQDAVDAEVMPRLVTGLAFDSPNIKAAYVRPGAAAVPITLITQTVDGAFSSGGFVQVSSANMPGVYRFDLPDLAVAAGARSADILVTVLDYGGFQDLSEIVTIDLVGYDPTVANLPANVTQLLGTAWLTPGTAGTPDVNARLVGGTAQTGRDLGASVLLSSGTGTGQVVLASGKLALTTAEHTAIANAAGVVQMRGTITGINDPTNFAVETSYGTSADINGMSITFYDTSSPGIMSDRRVVQTGGGDVEVDSAPYFSVEIGDTVIVTAVPRQLPNATAGEPAGLFIAGTNAQTTVTGGFGSSSIVAASFGAGAIDAAAMNVTGSEFTAVPWNSSWDIEAESEANDALVALNLDHWAFTATGIPAVPSGTWLDLIQRKAAGAFNRETDSLEAIADAGGGGGGGGTFYTLVAETTVASVPSTTTITLAVGPPDNDALTDKAFVIIVDQVDATQRAICPISDYVGATKTCTFSAAPVFTPVAGDIVYVIADPAVKAENIEAYEGSQLEQDIADVTGSVSPFNVDDDHTWSFNDRTEMTSSTIINEVVGFNAQVRMDFTEPMPVNVVIAQDGILSVTVADLAGQTEPLITASKITADGKGVDITLNCATTTPATYTFTEKIRTTDSQTFTRKGQITFEDD